MLAGLSAHSQALLTGRGFFPQLISKPFHNGLDDAFVFSIVACLVAAAASSLRGGRYHAKVEAPAPASPAARAPRRRRRASPSRRSSASSPDQLSL